MDNSEPARRVPDLNRRSDGIDGIGVGHGLPRTGRPRPPSPREPQTTLADASAAAEGEAIAIGSKIKRESFALLHLKTRYVSRATTVRSNGFPRTVTSVASARPDHRQRCGRGHRHRLSSRQVALQRRGSIGIADLHPRRGCAHAIPAGRRWHLPRHPADALLVVAPLAAAAGAGDTATEG